MKKTRNHSTTHLSTFRINACEIVKTAKLLNVKVIELLKYAVSLCAVDNGWFEEIFFSVFPAFCYLFVCITKQNRWGEMIKEEKVPNGGCSDLEHCARVTGDWKSNSKKTKERRRKTKVPWVKFVRMLDCLFGLVD